MARKAAATASKSEAKAQQAGKARKVTTGSEGEALIAALRSERDLLKKQLAEQRRRVKMLEKRQREAAQRIDSAITSLHNLLEG